jgi:SNF2 family DNA or RNA helicase
MSQKRVSDGKTLLELPPKSERVLTLTFQENEAEVYKVAELEAQSVYKMHRVHPAQVRRHTIMLLAQMLPMRQICSGSEPSSASDDPALNFGEETNEQSSTVASSSSSSTLVCGVCKQKKSSEHIYTCKSSHNTCIQVIHHIYKHIHIYVLSNVVGMVLNLFNIFFFFFFLLTQCYLHSSDSAVFKCLACEKDKLQATIEEEEKKKKNVGVVLDTKMNALFQELITVRTNDPTSKCLVFSQVSLEVKCFMPPTLLTSFAHP